MAVMCLACLSTKTSRRNHLSKYSFIKGYKYIKWHRVKTEVSLPVLGVVAGLLWGQGAGQSGHLNPDSVIQILLTGVDCAGNNERHSEQTRPVLLG